MNFANPKSQMKFSLSLVCFFLCLAPAFNQLNVIQIEGKAYYTSTNDSETQYIELSYGPLNDAQSIVLKENSTVVIINNTNEVCKLNEGQFNINELNFTAPESRSGFQQFCDYFKSFFMHHDASESKKYYVNNIYAITRGEKQAPVLDFPLEGTLSLDFGNIPFMWTHSADEAEYIFTIHDLDTKEIIFSSMTSEHSFELSSPERYLNEGQSYYWSVKVAGQEKGMTYENSVIQIGAQGKANEFLEKLETSLLDKKDNNFSTANFVYVLSQMEENDMENEAILYGLKKLQNDHSPAEKMILENFMYDIIADENLDF